MAGTWPVTDQSVETPSMPTPELDSQPPETRTQPVTDRPGETPPASSPGQAVHHRTEIRVARHHNEEGNPGRSCIHTYSRTPLPGPTETFLAFEPPPLSPMPGEQPERGPIGPQRDRATAGWAQLQSGSQTLNMVLALSGTWTPKLSQFGAG